MPELPEVKLFVAVSPSGSLARRSPGARGRHNCAISWT